MHWLLSLTLKYRVFLNKGQFVPCAIKYNFWTLQCQIRSPVSLFVYKNICDWDIWYQGWNLWKVLSTVKISEASRLSGCLLDGLNPCLGPSNNSIVCRHNYIMFDQWKVGKWADPGGTAMPGQPMTEPEQAPELYPLTKISLISKGAHGPRIRY